MIALSQVSRSFMVGDQQVATLRGITGAGYCINTFPQKPNAKRYVAALYLSPLRRTSCIL